MSLLSVFCIYLTACFVLETARARENLAVVHTTLCACVRGSMFAGDKKSAVQCRLNDEPTGENEVAMRNSLPVDCSGKRGNGK